MKKKTIMLFMIFILLFSSFFTAAAVDYSDADLESEEEIIGNIETPNDVYDLLKYFSRLKGNWTIYKDQKLVQDSTITYEYLTTENIMGEEADKISITIDDIKSDQMLLYFWVGKEDILQMEMDGQIIPKQMVDLLKKDLLSSVFAAFTMHKELDLEKLKEYGKTSRTTEVFGEEELDIIKIEGKYFDEMELKSGIIKLADFEEFLIVVEYEYITVDSSQEVDFMIQDIEMR